MIINERHTVLSEDYKIRSTQVNLNNHLGLYGILGMLQDAAAEHAESLGFGYTQLVKKGFFWALLQQKLKMDEWPKWNETITIQTWTKPIEGVYAVREFEIFHNGKKIGECASLWITISIESRRPIDLSKEQEIFCPRTDYSLDLKTNRVQLPENMQLIQNRKVQISDLDVNLHVNNVKYTKWVLDMVPLDQNKDFFVREYEINFLSETFLGDEVEGYMSKPKQIGEWQAETFFYGKKINQDKPAFISKWIAEKIRKK
ncbi:MAG: thioesterase [Capnocytophaga sp.]|nr:thioesterase [Capnocytophaga sp.]